MPLHEDGARHREAQLEPNRRGHRQQGVTSRVAVLEPALTQTLDPPQQEVVGAELADHAGPHQQEETGGEPDRQDSGRQHQVVSHVGQLTEAGECGERRPGPGQREPPQLDREDQEGQRRQDEGGDVVQADEHREQTTVGRPSPPPSRVHTGGQTDGEREELAVPMSRRVHGRRAATTSTTGAW